MAYEEGIVTALTESGAWIKTQKSSACAACSARNTCKADGGDATVEVRNDVNARTGDRVVIHFETASLLKATFLLYIAPIIGLLAGAAIGHKFAQAHAIDNPLPSVLAGFGLFALTVWGVKSLANRLSDRANYQPRITRIIKRAGVPTKTSE